jgi:regulator of RNase E activity RraA
MNTLTQRSNCTATCFTMLQPGDIVVVDARGDMCSGVFGEMMMTYFTGRGGAGAVVDGCIRDAARRKGVRNRLMVAGHDAEFSHTNEDFPFAVNVPVASGNRLVMPGDIIVADDDGAVVVPAKLVAAVREKASVHHEWEEFSRLRLREGGDLRRYYPLSDDARPEYEMWKRSRGE